MQAVVKVFTEFSFGCQRLEVTMSGSNQADVDLL